MADCRSVIGCHPKTLRSLSQTQQFHRFEIKQDQYGSLSDTLSLWALAPALFVIGIGTGLCFTTIPTVALGNAKPDEAGSASGSLSPIQQLASAIGSAAVTSVFFQAATSGLAHAMRVTLVVVLAVTALSLPIVALMPRKAPSEPQP